VREFYITANRCDVESLIEPGTKTRAGQRSFTAEVDNSREVALPERFLIVPTWWVNWVLVGQKKALVIGVRNDRPQRLYSGLLTSLRGNGLQGVVL
jgi:hypothetical protein